MSVDDAAESSAGTSLDSVYEAQRDTSKNIDTMNDFAEKKGTLDSVDDTATNSKDHEGVNVGLPQNLFSEGMEHGSVEGATHCEMTEEERKAAAMKTIAQLQEWASKANTSASVTSGVSQASRVVQQGMQMNGGQNDNSQIRLAMLLQQQQQREAQQMLLLQQQQQQQQQQQEARKRSDVLQRIIQDYLQGKQLSVYELQVLQQYIQQQQQQRTAAHPNYAMPAVQKQQQTYISGNVIPTASVPDYASAYYAREQRPQYPVGPQGSLSEAVRLQQERIAAATAAGQAQARLGQIQREAMLAMHSQKPVHYNTPGGMSLEDQLLAMARSGSHTPDVAARINAQQYLNGATQQDMENGFRKPQYQQPVYADVMRQQAPSMYYQNGQVGIPATDHPMRSTNSTQNLQDIGKTLAQLGISVEGAVNAGLLGGLSASDVRVVAESHRLACERVSFPNNGNGVSAAPAFPGVVKSQSFGNLSAPSPSSPVGSIGNVSSASLPVNTQQSALSPTSKSTSIAEDDHEQALLDQIVTDDPHQSMKKNAVDQEWLMSKVENSSSRFNAAQYGFFGQDDDATVLSDELELYEEDQGQVREDDKLSDYLAGLKLGTGFM